MKEQHPERADVHMEAGPCEEPWSFENCAATVRTRNHYTRGLKTYQRDVLHYKLHYKHIGESFGSSSLGSISNADVQKWITDPKSHTQAKHDHHWLDYANNFQARGYAKYIPINPCDGIELPRVVQTVRRYLDCDQVKHQADVIAEPYRAMVYIGCYLGLRWGEIAGLQRRHVKILKRQLWSLDP